MFSERGANFCVECGRPGPWVSRADRIAWLKDRLLEEQLDEATKLELREVLDRLAAMPVDDTRAAAGWQRLKEAAPEVWGVGKPVLTTVIGEGLKKLLGL